MKKRRYGAPIFSLTFFGLTLTLSSREIAENLRWNLLTWIEEGPDRERCEEYSNLELAQSLRRSRDFNASGLRRISANA